ncbi:hypothetical protein [Acidovorax sp. sic0104]|uniref:hypothetical protein n=1 Tax=Acidovorax sp. sic0104 TaxID=2854784 RepID=UPI001C47169D|nr:hypothetical protein [Acidovorax sp. sic0104]MBV7542029.1 hypothetical protein [Acidovorax sp. sic0104]
MATISYTKRVTAFRGSDSCIYYALFEEARYTNSDHPNQWSCIGFGPLHQVMEQIFFHGSLCEIGSMRRPTGKTSPSAYIQEWLEQLACPHEQSDVDVRVKFVPSYGPSVSRERQLDVFNDLDTRGYADLAHRLLTGEPCELRLHADPVAFQLLHGAVLPLSQALLWPQEAAPRADLGWAPTPSERTEFSLCRYARLDDRGLLIHIGADPWRYVGSESRVIGNFIRGRWMDEIRYPGSTFARLAALRKALREAPTVPDGTNVVIDTRESMDYDHQNVKRIQGIAALLDRVTVRETKRGIELSIPKDPAGLACLTALPAECLVWELPTTAGASAPIAA